MSFEATSICWIGLTNLFGYLILRCAARYLPGTNSFIVVFMIDDNGGDGSKNTWNISRNVPWGPWGVLKYYMYDLCLSFWLNTNRTLLVIIVWSKAFVKCQNKMKKMLILWKQHVYKYMQIRKLQLKNTYNFSWKIFQLWHDKSNNNRKLKHESLKKMERK